MKRERKGELKVKNEEKEIGYERADKREGVQRNKDREREGVKRNKYRE